MYEEEKRNTQQQATSIGPDSGNEKGKEKKSNSSGNSGKRRHSKSKHEKAKQTVELNENPPPLPLDELSNEAVPKERVVQ